MHFLGNDYVYVQESRGSTLGAVYRVSDGTMICKLDLEHIRFAHDKWQACQYEMVGGLKKDSSIVGIVDARRN